MRKTLLAALPLTLMALAVPATAQAKSYRAKISPLAAAPTGSATRHGAKRRARDAAGVRGKARLTDGARRDRVRLTVRGLERGQRFTWSLRKAAAGDSACAGDVVDAFDYGTLRRGRRHDSDRARGFAVEPGAVYAVVVTAADGTDVACGEFGARSAGGGEKGGSDQLDDDDRSEDESGVFEDESGRDDAAEQEDESDDDSADNSLEDDDLGADDEDEDLSDF